VLDGRVNSLCDLWTARPGNPATHLEGISMLTSDFAKNPCLGPRLDQRHGGEPAESDIPTLPLDNGTQDPSLRPRAIHAKIKTVAVRV
jgi:hypothetical protein